MPRPRAGDRRGRRRQRERRRQRTTCVPPPESPSTSSGVAQTTSTPKRKVDPIASGSIQAQGSSIPAPSKTQVPRGRGLPSRPSEGARKPGEPSGSQALRGQPEAALDEPMDESGPKSKDDRPFSSSESLPSTSCGNTDRPKNTSKKKNAPRIKIDF